MSAASLSKPANLTMSDRLIMEPPFASCHFPGSNYLPDASLQVRQNYQDVASSGRLVKELVQPFPVSPDMSFIR